MLWYGYSIRVDWPSEGIDIVETALGPDGPYSGEPVYIYKNKYKGLNS